MTVFSHLRPQRDLRKLKKHVDYKYYVFEHSGHGLQNDNAMSKNGWYPLKNISTNICL